MRCDDAAASAAPIRNVLQQEDHFDCDARPVRWPGFLLFVLLFAGTGCGRQSSPVSPSSRASSEPDDTVAISARGEFGQALKAELARAHPDHGEWGSEKFHERAKQQLHLLGAWVFEGATLPTALLDPSATLPTLENMAFVEERDTLGVSVRRAASAQSEDAVTPELFRLAIQSESAFVEDVHFKMKVYRVAQDADSAVTQVLVAASGLRGNGDRAQVNSEWRVEWRAAENTALSISQIEVLRWETVVVSEPGDPWFEDCAGAALADIATSGDVRRQFGAGLPYWARRHDSGLQIEPTGYNGLAIGDVNNDGLEDLYVCQTGGLPNRLLMQMSDGTVQDRSREAGVDFLDNARAALIVDLDNDGDRDLAIGVYTELVLLENDGTGKFAHRASLALKSSAFSLASVDADGNGMLDLYVCGYGEVWGGVNERGDQIPLPMHDAKNGGANHFFLNRGHWQFAESSQACGLDENNDRWSLSAAWEDFDLDGDFDLYVANDFGRNNLYRNDLVPSGQIHFRDVAAEMEVEDLSPGMSAAWGDADNDGLPDLYVSNMFSSAGNRIAFQSDFLPGTSETVRAARSGLQRMSRGNTLLRNRGEHFEDASVNAGVTVGRWAWASQFADIDNDGFQDLLVCNGFMTGDNPDDL